VLVLKTQSVQINDFSLTRNSQICGKAVFLLQPIFASLLDSAKFYCFFVMILTEILIQKNDKKIQRLKEAFKINDSNKDDFYDLCISYYSTANANIASTKLNETTNKEFKSDKTLISYKNMNLNAINNCNSNNEKPTKPDFEFAKFLFIFVIFLVFIFIRQALYLMNSYVFYDNIITKFYFYELFSYVIIGFLALMINKNIDKYF